MTGPIVRAAAEPPCDREPVHVPGVMQPHGAPPVPPLGGDVAASLAAASETVGSLSAAAETAARVGAGPA